jgi:glyoxylase-like metal-dependent hydrolase (beta-lactamase superfamily II)
MLMFGRLQWVMTLGGLLWAGAVVAQPPHPPQPSRPQAVAVAPGAYMVQGLSALGSGANRNFISNAGFVVTPQGVLVVDALGSPVLARELLAEIRRITDAPVRWVVLTHYHADHVYGLQVFKDEGATIVAHQDGKLYLNSDTAALRLQASREELAPAVDAGTRLVAADRWIAQRSTLPLGGIDVVLQPAGPAHTPEDLVVWVPQLKLLFAGDLVFRGRIPFVGQADSGRWITALDTLLAFDAAVIVPGHGPASTEARADLELTRDYLVHLRRTMGEAARNMDPFDEAYARTDWSRFEHLPLFKAANRINAYNTYLLMEQAGK